MKQDYVAIRQNLHDLVNQYVDEAQEHEDDELKDIETYEQRLTDFVLWLKLSGFIK